MEIHTKQCQNRKEKLKVQKHHHKVRRPQCKIKLQNRKEKPKVKSDDEPENTQNAKDKSTLRLCVENVLKVRTTGHVRPVTPTPLVVLIWNGKLRAWIPLRPSGVPVAKSLRLKKTNLQIQLQWGFV